MPDHRLFDDFHPRHAQRAEPRHGDAAPLSERITADFRHELARLDELLGRTPEPSQQVGRNR